MQEYISMGGKPESFQDYLTRYIYSVTSQEEYLERVGGIKKLTELKRSISMEEYL